MGEKLKDSLQSHRIGREMMLESKFGEESPFIGIELNRGRLSGIS